MHRVGEAADTVARLGRRVKSGAARNDPSSRDLIGRLALQLWLVNAGVDDALKAAAGDVVLVVDASLTGKGDADAQAVWCARMRAMYAAWAEHRRMQVQFVPGVAGGASALLVSGFGAYRTLVAEAGLHVLDYPAGEGQRREVARVRVIEAPDEDDDARLPGRIAEALASLVEVKTVTRRYRERPSPLVRDAASGGRSGHLDQVLAGDFDLVFAKPAVG
jgi:ATP-dependent Clp protease ATP-binding subunit ClpC